VDIDTFPNPACFYKVRLEETVESHHIAVRDFPPWSEVNSGGLLVVRNSIFSRLFIEELTETLQGHWFMEYTHIDMLCHADALLAVLRIEAIAKLSKLVDDVADANDVSTAEQKRFRVNVQLLLTQVESADCFTENWSSSSMSQWNFSYCYQKTVDTLLRVLSVLPRFEWGGSSISPAAIGWTRDGSFDPSSSIFNMRVFSQKDLDEVFYKSGEPGSAIRFFEAGKLRTTGSVSPRGDEETWVGGGTNLSTSVTTWMLLMQVLERRSVRALFSFDAVSMHAESHDVLYGNTTVEGGKQVADFLRYYRQTDRGKDEIIPMLVPRLWYERYDDRPADLRFLNRSFEGKEELSRPAEDHEAVFRAWVTHRGISFDSASLRPRFVSEVIHFVDVRILDLNHKPTDYTHAGAQLLASAYKAQGVSRAHQHGGRTSMVEQGLTPFVAHWPGLVFNEKTGGMLLYSQRFNSSGLFENWFRRDPSSEQELRELQGEELPQDGSIFRGDDVCEWARTVSFMENNFCSPGIRLEKLKSCSGAWEAGFLCN